MQTRFGKMHTTYRQLTRIKGEIMLRALIRVTFIALITLLSLGMLCTAVAYYVWIVQEGLPDITKTIESYHPDVITTVYGTDFEPDGTQKSVEVGRIFRQKTTPLPAGPLPELLVKAVVAAEDKRFFEHDGVDWQGFLSVLKDLVRWGKFRGGSTITMQVVKAFTSNEKTLKRKFREIFLADILEKKLAEKNGSKQAAKEQILRWYLSYILHVGNGAYGAEEAARMYFNATAKDLTLQQAAAIASLPTGASRFTVLRGDPKKIAQSHRALMLRSAYVLSAMEKNGYISAEEKAEALAHPVTLGQVRSVLTEDVCAEFVTMVSDRLPELYGENYTQKQIHVQTSCIIPLQKELRKLSAEHTATIDHDNGSSERPEIAVVVLDNATGHVIALIGGNDYHRGELIRPNKPVPIGSIAKMFLALAALRQGYVPTDVFYDAETTIPSPAKGVPPWTPHDAHKPSNAWKSLADALAESLNIPYARLAYTLGSKEHPYAGIDEMQHVLNELRTGATAYQGYSSALGVFDVAPVRLAAATAAIAQDGRYREPLIITRVRDISGTDPTWQHFESPAEQVIRPSEAFLMQTMLRRMITHGTGRYLKTYPSTTLFGKTGTVQGNTRGALTIASREYTIFITIGTDKPSPLGTDKSGTEIQGARNTRLAKHILDLLKSLPRTTPIAREYPVPTGVISLPTVLSETGDDNEAPHPRCAITTDPSDRVTSTYYLEEYLPEGCEGLVSQEILDKQKPRPRLDRKKLGLLPAESGTEPDTSPPLATIDTPSTETTPPPDLQPSTPPSPQGSPQSQGEIPHYEKDDGTF